MINRVIIMVLDGFGVGESPDAYVYKDEGSNTIAGIYNNTKLDNYIKSISIAFIVLYIIIITKRI